MRLRDEAAMSGVLELRIYRKGLLLSHWQDRNLIVTGARELMARLIAGDPASAISAIGFGEGAAPAEPDDQTLLNAYWRPLAGHDYPAPGQVRFLFDLGIAEANDLAIREFGLRTESGALFSRKVRGVIEKSEDISLSGSWTITF